MPGMTWKAVTCSAVPVSYMRLWIAQRDVQDTWSAAVQQLIGSRRVLEGHLRRGQCRHRQVAEQGGGHAAAAGDVPAGGQHGGDRRHPAAADGQPAPVERAAERQRHLLPAVPRPDQGGPFIGEQGGGVRERPPGGRPSPDRPGAAPPGGGGGGARAGAAGARDSSTSSGTPRGGTRPGSSSGGAAGMPSERASSRRSATGSAARTLAPARCSSREV